MVFILKRLLIFFLLSGCITVKNLSTPSTVTFPGTKLIIMGTPLPTIKDNERGILLIVADSLGNFRLKREN